MWLRLLPWIPPAMQLNDSFRDGQPDYRSRPFPATSPSDRADRGANQQEMSSTSLDLYWPVIVVVAPTNPDGTPLIATYASRFSLGSSADQA